ncbi:MAG: hypothetical protein Kow00108_03780 [Calditrichia bacterium]
MHWYESPLLLNIIYAMGGIFLGVLSAIFTYQLFSKITHFNIQEELEKGNLAVGMVVGGLFIMIGLIVGLIIGMSLN